MTKGSIKIVTPVGMLGYGFDQAELYAALNEGAQAIIVDSGSTDSGPQKLALGGMTCPRESYVRDLKPLVDAAVGQFKPKILISSAGGDGTNTHVDELASIVEDYAKERCYKLKIVKIYADIDKNAVNAAFEEGKISPCGSAPQLAQKDIDDTVSIVAQMGHEPFVKAMQDHPDFDIIIAGRAYDPAPYVAFCVNQGFNDLGIAYNMGKVMECGGLCLTPKSKLAVAEIWRDRFEISSVSPSIVCTEQSLAAHTLYEKTRPDLLPGPGGTLDLRSAVFKANGAKASASGAKFIHSDTYTIKLEGAKLTGYQTLFMGSVADPILVSNMDEFVQGVISYVKGRIPGDYNIEIARYGGNQVLSKDQNQHSNQNSVFLLGKVLASSQELANNVASLARVGLVHGPYPNQKATAGNLAMPVVPLEIPLGQSCEFSLYHVMEVDDPLVYFPVSAVEIRAPRAASQIAAPSGLPEQRRKKDSTIFGIPKAEGQPLVLPESMKHGSPGFQFLYQLAKVVRSKNAGPFEVTLDVIFNNRSTFEHVKQTGVLNKDALCKILGVYKKDIVALVFFEQSNSFKVTVVRQHASGSFRDSDIHASQQHVPLMFLEVPASSK